MAEAIVGYLLLYLWISHSAKKKRDKMLWLLATAKPCNPDEDFIDAEWEIVPQDCKIDHAKVITSEGP